MIPATWPRAPALLRFSAASTILVALYVLLSGRFHISGHNIYDSVIGQKPAHRLQNDIYLPGFPCHTLPIGNETVVVLRTGSTELEARFPIQASTSLPCFPNHLIFSDHEEDYLGYHVLDALESVDQDIITNHPDFGIYRRLKQGGRAVLNASELSGPGVIVEGASGNSENPGWKLDKWKFLPMLNRTLAEYPHMKWYVFIEADTLIFWSTLQAYLAATEPNKLHYAGDTLNIGDITFAHGGTGFIVSQPALRTLVEYYAAHKAEIAAFTDTQWAGDGVLGKTFADAGVALTDIYPLMQGQDPGLVLYARKTANSIPWEDWQVWCSPTISYHHLSPPVLDDLWHLEQKFMSGKGESDLLRHKDIFTQYVMPQMMTPRTDWDNLSDVEHSEITSVEECRAACAAEEKCRQYSYDATGHCKTRINPRLGMVREGVQSGWIGDRIKNYEHEIGPCGNEGLEKIRPG